MKRRFLPLLLSVGLVLMLTVTIVPGASAKKLIIFAGGPAGGTFR